LDRIRIPEGSETAAMTVRQVAAYLNVNQKTVHRLAQRRELPSFKVAGAWRFKRDDIEQWIERQKKSGPGSPVRGAQGTNRSELGGRGDSSRRHRG
jgi:excisionase family DNA binding protein